MHSISTFGATVNGLKLLWMIIYQPERESWCFAPIGNHPTNFGVPFSRKPTQSMLLQNVDDLVEKNVHFDIWLQYVRKKTQRNEQF